MCKYSHKICIINHAQANKNRPLRGSNLLPEVKQLNLKEIIQQLMALLAENAFRVKLDTVQRKLFMGDTHDLVRLAIAFGPGGKREALRQALCGNDQRMVARHGKGIIQTIKNALSGMTNRRGFAMDGLTRPHHLPTKSLRHGLMPKANAENRQPLSKVGDGRHGNARVVRRAGAGRDHQMGRGQLFNISETELIVTFNQHLGTQLAKILIEVIGKRVVVVDQQQHGGPGLQSMKLPGQFYPLSRLVAAVDFTDHFLKISVSGFSSPNTAALLASSQRTCPTFDHWMS